MDEPATILKNLTGNWRGTAKTWFRPGESKWSWRTEYAPGGDKLTITAYNIVPTGEETKAVKVLYTPA